MRADAELARDRRRARGTRSRRGQLLLGTQVSAEGRSRAFLGGASVPASALTRVGDALVAVHGQSDQHRLLRPEAQRDALDAFAGAPLADVLARYRAAFDRLGAVERELREVLGSARERAREADVLRLGLEEIEAVDAQSWARRSRWPRRRPGSGYADTLRTAAETAREALSSDQDAADALGAVAAARRALESVRDHDPEAASLADRVAEVSYLLADVAADVASYSTGVETDPAAAGGRLRAPGRPDRPHPEVRRDRRRGDRVVPAGRRTADRASRTPTRASRPCAPRGCSSGPCWPARQPS